MYPIGDVRPPWWPQIRPSYPATTVSMPLYIDHDSQIQVIHGIWLLWPPDFSDNGSKCENMTMASFTGKHGGNGLSDLEHCNDHYATYRSEPKTLFSSAPGAAVQCGNLGTEMKLPMCGNGRICSDHVYDMPQRAELCPEVTNTILYIPYVLFSY